MLLQVVRNEYFLKFDQPKIYLEKTNLDGIVEGSLALDVLCIDVGPVLEKELAQLDALHAVDQAGASVVVGPLDVRIVGHLHCRKNKI